MSLTSTSLRRRAVTTDDGVTLPVVESGDPDGAPVVLVHGLASSSAEFAGVLADPRLAGYRLMAFDLRGHGADHQHLQPSQITADSPAALHALWVRDLQAMLADLPAAHLVGSSFGATVVQSWLRLTEAAGTAAGVTLVAGTPVLGPVPDGDPAAELVTPEAVAALAGAATGGQGAYAARVLAQGPSDASVDPDLAAAVAATAAGTQPEAVAAGLAPFDARDFWLSRPQQRARTSVVVCEGDQIFQATAARRCWKQVDLTPQVAAGACHSFPLRDPEAFTTYLAQALLG